MVSTLEASASPRDQQTISVLCTEVKERKGPRKFLFGMQGLAFGSRLKG